MVINIFIGVCLSKMLPSHINKLSEAYTQIAEGKKSEEEVKDWNRKDDNPKGKKVSKKEVDKCTCESFYLKRLQAMNPMYADEYRAIAAVLIGEGYQSARLLDNIIESLPMNFVGPEFISAMKAVNPNINENLQSAEKKQARAIVENLRIKSPQEWWDGIKAAKNRLFPGRAQSNEPSVRSGARTPQTGFGHAPSQSSSSTSSGPTAAQKAEKLRQQRQETQSALRGTTRTTQTGERSAAANDAKQQAAKAQAQAARTTATPAAPAAATGSGSAARVTPAPAAAPKPTTNRDGSSVTRTGTNNAGQTPMQQWAKNFPKLAAKVKPGQSGYKEISSMKNSYEPEGEQLDEFLGAGAQKAVDSATKKIQGGLEKVGVKINRTQRNTARPSAQTANTMRQNKATNEEVEQFDEGIPVALGAGAIAAGLATWKAIKGAQTVNKFKKDAEQGTGLAGRLKKRSQMLNQETEVEGEMVEEGSLKQARKNVGASTCWDGYKAKGTKKKNGRDVPNCVKEEELEEKKKGLWANIHAKRKRGEKPAKPGDKDYPKTLDIEEGYDKPDEKLKTDRDGYRISKKDADAAKERIRKKTEEKRKKMNIRGNDSEEQKKRLEKKRGMKLDDHPQFKKEEVELDETMRTGPDGKPIKFPKLTPPPAVKKGTTRKGPDGKDVKFPPLTPPPPVKEDYSFYDIILTFLDENNLMESVEEAEEIMMQLTGAQIVEIIDEFMSMEEQSSTRSMADQVTDALPWNRNTKYTTKGELRKPGENVHGRQTGRKPSGTASMRAGGTAPTNRPPGTGGKLVQRNK